MTFSAVVAGSGPASVALAARAAQGLGAQRQTRVLRPGLSLQFGNETRCEARQGQAVVQDFLRIVLVLEGSLDLTYGCCQMQLAAASRQRGPRAGSVDVGMVTLLEPAECRRVVRQGDCARRISIGVARSWLAGSLGEAAWAAHAGGPRLRHLQVQAWQASPRVRLLAEQMLHPPDLPDAVVGMYLESRVIELVMEAWLQTGPMAERPTATAPTAALRPALQRRMQELRQWLRENAAADVSLEQLAQDWNTTPTTLQRHFRRMHGMSIFACLQSERLQLARRALERDGVDVARAADLAGYTSASSFATAFKRQFGRSPRQARQIA